MPYVGPALALCECITGKAWCLPSGKDLSDEERIFSGVGFAVAGGPALWRGVKTSGLSPAAAAIAEDIERMGFGRSGPTRSTCSHYIVIQDCACPALGIQHVAR